MKTMLVAAALLALWSGAAVAQSKTTPILGTVSAVTGTELDLTKPDGSVASLKLTDKTRFAYVTAMTVGDIQPNSYVGVGATTGADGTNTAVEVTVFPESARGAGEGHGPWNQGPSSTMTNGTVAQVVSSNGHTLTVTYKDGQQDIVVPDGTPVTTFALADKSALVTGANVLVRATKGEDGSFTAGFVSIGKDGYVPKG
jgi:hypothetical protein